VQRSDRGFLKRHKLAACKQERVCWDPYISWQLIIATQGNLAVTLIQVCQHTLHVRVVVCGVLHHRAGVAASWPAL
jgi:hypothetical protein